MPNVRRNVEWPGRDASLLLLPPAHRGRRVQQRRRDQHRWSPTSAADNGNATASTVRLGYFANVTHTPAIVGVEQGLLADKLGDTKLETSTFNAGPAAVEALFADALDITFIGPNPSINAYAQSNGEAIRIVSGSTSGGAYLITKPEITSAEDLRGKTVATPQLGNTQDVALRSWLKDKV